MDVKFIILAPTIKDLQKKLFKTIAMWIHLVKLYLQESVKNANEPHFSPA